MILPFVKMHGIGNDMVLIDNLSGDVSLSEQQVAEICHRKFGVGADGLILIEKGSSEDGEVDFFMNYYNGNGSIGEMCGNGIRCAAKYFERLKGFEGSLMKVATRAGVKEIVKEGSMYVVNMGEAEFESADFVEGSLDFAGLKMKCLSMGNPHAVALLGGVDDFDLAVIGPEVEQHENFPNGVNFEIFEMEEDEAIKMRVWERGSGLTMACGTGACAVYVVAKRMGLVRGEDFVEVRLPGGSLWIRELEVEGATVVLMKGGAEFVFEGEIEV